MPVDPVVTRRFIESLSTHLEDHLASWKSALADTRADVVSLLTAMGEKIPAQAKPLFPEDIMAMLLEDALPPPLPPEKVVERVVEKVVERVEVPVPGAGTADWTLVKGSLSAIESARSQVDVLTRFLAEALVHSSRVALLVLRGDRITGWKAMGFDASGGRDDVVKAIDLGSSEDPFLAAAIKAERSLLAAPPDEESPLRRAAGGQAPARTFLVPMVIRDRLSGLLVADELPGEEGRLNEAALEVLTFLTGLTVDLLAARKKIPSPALTPRGEAYPVFRTPAQEQAAAALAAREARGARAAGEEPPAPAAAPAAPAPPPSEPGRTIAVAAIQEEPAAPPAPQPPPPPPPQAPPPPPPSFSAVTPSWPVPPPPPAFHAPEPQRTSPPVSFPGGVPAPAAGPSSQAELAGGRSPLDSQDVSARVRRKMTDAGEALRALEESASSAARRKLDPLASSPDLLGQTPRPYQPTPPPVRATPPPSPPPTSRGDLTLAFEQLKSSPAGGGMADLPTPSPAPAPLPPPRPVAPPTPVGTVTTPPPPDLSSGGPATPIAPPAGFVPRGGRGFRSADDPQRAVEDARRLARLLVSEIKLYNERKVQEGRAAGDLYQRLKDDIERSRQLFVERTPESVRQGTDFFHDELVRVLADGKPDALGPMP